jgi:hypothetical protein
MTDRLGCIYSDTLGTRMRPQRAKGLRYGSTGIARIDRRGGGEAKRSPVKTPLRTPVDTGDDPVQSTPAYLFQLSNS